MTRENDGLLSLLPTEECMNIKEAVRNVSSWYDFAQIFSDYEFFLQNLPLPAQQFPTLAQAIVDIERERFTLRFAKGVRRAVAVSIAATSASPARRKAQNSRRFQRGAAGFSPKASKGAVGIDEKLESDVVSGLWHDVHQKIADALGVITDNEPALLDIITRAVSRTLGGGDAFFVCQELFGTAQLLVTPSHAAPSSEIEVCFFPGGIISVRTPSVFDIRSLAQMDGKEMVEVHVTHVLNLSIGDDRRAGVDGCSVVRHLLIDSPDSQVSADVSDLMGL